MDRAQVLRFPENCDETLRFIACARNLHKFVQNYAPTADGKADQQDQDRLDYWSRAEKHIDNAKPARAAHLLTPLCQKLPGCNADYYSHRIQWSQFCHAPTVRELAPDHVSMSSSISSFGSLQIVIPLTSLHACNYTARAELLLSDCAVLTNGESASWHQ